MDKYLDPQNIEEIKSQLSEKKTMKDILELVNEIYPDWIITFADKFSTNYPSLTVNWVKTCEKMGSRPAQIMIVDDIIFDDDHKLLQLFGDVFTKTGFSVKSKNHFIPCGRCKSAYPTLSIHQLLKESDNVVPAEWMCC